MILTDSQIEHATWITERLRISTPGGASCSVGLAEGNCDEAPATLVERADQALYEAKRGGRNRTVAMPLAHWRPATLFGSRVTGREDCRIMVDADALEADRLDRAAALRSVRRGLPLTRAALRPVRVPAQLCGAVHVGDPGLDLVWSAAPYAGVSLAGLWC